jgi:glycosyltransferase involved in cell wall biosynthesis
VWQIHLPAAPAALAKRIESLWYRPYAQRQVVAVSESTRADLASVGVLRVSVIPQGGLGRQDAPSKSPQPTLLFVGRLVANKRPDHAIEAFRIIRSRMPEAQLWLIGEGKMKETLARGLPPGAELLGRVSRGEVLERMGRAHLLLATSVREGWGLVVTEANALGTPAVAYDVPGLRDSVRSGVTGASTAVEPTALAATALSLLRNVQRYEKMRQAAIEWGSVHSWDRTASVLMEHLREVVESGPKASDGKEEQRKLLRP